MRLDWSSAFLLCRAGFVFTTHSRWSLETRRHRALNPSFSQCLGVSSVAGGLNFIFPTSSRTGTPACDLWISEGYRISGGVNGVDQLRLDMASRVPCGTESGKCLLSHTLHSIFFTTAALESPAGEDGEGFHEVDSFFFSLPPSL